MAPLAVDLSSLLSGMSDDGPGALFEEVVLEAVKPEYEHLRTYAAAGKDGGIDLLDDPPSGVRTAFECKFVGDGRFKTATSRWKATQRNLARNLPTKAAAQYAMWWDAEQPIRRYVFCTSAKFSGPSQAERLKTTIGRFFDDIAAANGHLAHLADLEVEVLHAGDLELRLRDRPHLLHRWFGTTLPVGLVPLEDVSQRTPFLSYLEGDELDYYSREHHLEHNAPSGGAAVFSEGDVIDQFDEFDVAIITGAGGHGKTRLTLECARQAQLRGWVVLRVNRRLTIAALEALATQIGAASRVLLVTDYIENEPEFPTVTEHLVNLNVTYGLTLKVIANCRTTYYRKVEDVPNHVRIAIGSDASTEAWHTAYRKATVEYILESSGVSADSSALAVCGDVPVLAVFLVYLHRTGREGQLTELIQMREFGTWIRRRTKRSFPDMAEEDLALLVTLLPLPEAVADQLSTGRYGRLLVHLERDGWIERVSPTGKVGEGVWAAIHDVFADRVICTYLAELGSFVKSFVTKVFDTADSMGVLRTAMVSLQRLAQQPELESADWLELLSEELTLRPDRWKPLAALLVRTSLLSELETVQLLERHDELFVPAIQELSFRRSVNSLAYRLVASEEVLEPETKDALTKWIGRSLATQVDTYSLVPALELSPLEFRIRAHAWLVENHQERHAAYVLAAWLRGGLGEAPIKDLTLQWLAAHPFADEMGYILRDWFRAGGPRETLYPYLAEWLRERGTEVSAWWMLTSWLHNGGESGLVSDHVHEWLSRHSELLNARYLIRSWVAAVDDPEALREPLVRWLAVHGGGVEAGPVLASWLNSTGSLPPVQATALNWVEHNAEADVAGVVLAAWLRRTGEWQSVEGGVARWMGANHRLVHLPNTIEPWLDAGGPWSVVAGPAHGWLEEHGLEEVAGVIYRSALTADAPKEDLRAGMRLWMSENATTANAQLVLQAWLDSGGAAAEVEEDIEAWLKCHGSEARAQYLLRSWLRSGAPRQLVEPPVLRWLRQHGSDPIAGLLLESWLAAGFEPETVRKQAVKWLARYGNKPQAWTFVEAWLGAGGDGKLVRRYVDAVPWLRRRPGAHRRGRGSRR